MQRLLQDLSDTLLEFFEQADDHLLLLGCGDTDVPLVLKTQEVLRVQNSDIHFAHADPFTDAETYTLSMAHALRRHFEAANEERTNKGEPPLEQFPAQMLAANTSPRERVRIAAEHFARWLPGEGDSRVVFALLPTRIEDWDAYSVFVGSLARHGAVESWMQSTRLVVREDVRRRPLLAMLTRLGTEDALSWDVDFSTPALAAALVEDTIDPAIAIGQRMQALLQLAMIDMTYRRFSEAVEKYRQLYDFYREIKEPLMQALCLQGVGDSLRMSGATADALARYQSGLALAMCAEVPRHLGRDAASVEGAPQPMHPNAPPILLNLCLAAGEASSELGQLANARSYFESASLFASRVMNPLAASQALERKGDCERQLELIAECQSSWQQADRIAELSNDFLRRESVLGRLEQLYRDARMHREAEQAHITRLAVQGAQGTCDAE